MTAEFLAEQSDPAFAQYAVEGFYGPVYLQNGYTQHRGHVGYHVAQYRVHVFLSAVGVISAQVAYGAEERKHLQTGALRVREIRTVFFEMFGKPRHVYLGVLLDGVPDAVHLVQQVCGLGVAAGHGYLQRSGEHRGYERVVFFFQNFFAFAKSGYESLRDDFDQKVSWKVFTDWNTEKTGEGTSYNPGDKYTAKDIELHAQLRDWNILDSDVGTKFEYDVTGKILDLTQYEFINTLVGEANGLLTEYTTVTAEPVEATVAGTYTQTISAIDAETSEATYDRTGLVDVTLTVKFNGIEDMDAPERTVLLAILKIQKNSDGEYLKDFTKTDVSITSTDNGFGIAGTGVIKVSEIDLITEEGAPYVNTVLNKSVTPVDVAGAGAVDKSSKIILDLDLSVTGKVEMTAALSGVEGLPWM